MYLLLAISILPPNHLVPHLTSPYPILHSLSQFHVIFFYTIPPPPSPLSIFHALSHSVSFHLLLYPTSSLTPFHFSSIFLLSFILSPPTLSYLIPCIISSFIHFLTLFHFIPFYTILPHPSPILSFIHFLT